MRANDEVGGPTLLVDHHRTAVVTQRGGSRASWSNRGVFGLSLRSVRLTLRPMADDRDRRRGRRDPGDQ
jgi:hypothetical protein